MMKIKKLKNFKYKIICIDGFFGSGKTLLAPLLATYQDVQNQIISYNFDNYIILNYLKKIDNLTCKEMIRFNTDEIAFNYEIGRNINFRTMDHTGIKFNPNYKLDINKIFKNNEKKSIKKLSSNYQTVLNIMTHKTFLNSDLINKIFNKKRQYTHIIMVRHPVLMFNHYYNFFKNIEKSAKNFRIYIEKLNKYLPWFQKKISNISNKKLPDKIINVFEFLFKEINNVNNKCLIIPFEEFVINPFFYLKKIEKKILIKKKLSHLKMQMKLNNLPRKSISRGIKHVKYGIISKSSDKKLYYSEYNKILRKISKSSKKKFIKLIENYNIKYSSFYQN